MAITVEEAGDVLRRMHSGALHGEKSISLIIFGVKYADDLEGMTLASVIQKSGIHPTADVEIGYGMKLAQYVQIKPDADMWL